MAVVTVTTLTVKPDHMEEYLDLARKSKAILEERCGSKNCRLLAAVVAGEATGTMAFIAESDDFAASGAALDKLLADAEGSAVMSSLNTSTGSIASYQTAMWVDVPL